MVLTRHSRTGVQTSATGVFWKVKELSDESQSPKMELYSWVGVGFQVEGDLKTPIFWGFLLESALEVNKLALRESPSLSCVELIVLIMLLL